MESEKKNRIVYIVLNTIMWATIAVIPTFACIFFMCIVNNTTLGIIFLISSVVFACMPAIINFFTGTTDFTAIFHIGKHAKKKE